MKKIIIFLVTLILVFSLIYSLPIKIMLQIENRKTDLMTLNYPYLQKLDNIIKSDIDQKYKDDAMSLVSESRSYIDEQGNSFYSILLYIGVIINLSLIGLSVFLVENTEHKVVGKSLMAASILSFIFMCILIYLFMLNSGYVLF